MSVMMMMMIEFIGAIEINLSIYLSKGM